MVHNGTGVARRALAAAAVALAAAPAAEAQGTPRDPLPSWRDGAAKRAILALVRATTTRGGEFVPPVDRVATFDNDGCLWVEHPLYTQFVFAIDRLREMAQRDPSLATREPLKAAIEGDMRGVMASGEKGLAEIIARRPSWRS